MYLMNVPPVAATQTEWRTCGPPGGYSLPVCFNDSETELSTRGTPITDKVQMIIESLRSSQSSLEMGDEIEGNGLSGQEGHPQVGVVAVGSCVGAVPKGTSPTNTLQEDVPSARNYESTDSDSDDSVDRGIEEAILEYLKEKDDHKRKGEPCSSLLQPSKIARKSPPVPELSKHHAESNAFLIAGGQFPKSIEVETTFAPPPIPIKKFTKNKVSLQEDTFQGFDVSRCAPTSLVCPTKHGDSPPETILSLNKAGPFPVRVKVEEESDDSSSDDGIEEAIQRYQLEKKEQLNKKEYFDPLELEDDSDSTSDDGIEEAICRYQLEQSKEKTPLNPFLQKEKSFSQSFMPAVGSTSTETTKKHTLKKKKVKTEKDEKSLQPPLTSGLVPKTTVSDTSKGKGHGPHLFKHESLNESVASKVKTTAELMCAEAILDISKTVIPGSLQQTVSPSSRASTERSSPNNCQDDESDDSSIDSEDGIELEIRKFLEQKAQIHKKPVGESSVSQEPHSVNEQEKAKAKEAAVLKKPSKLSLTQRRNEKTLNVSNIAKNDGALKDVATNAPSEVLKESNPLIFPQTSQQPVGGLYRADQSGDKSSSFDSDEDLDNAIKDLLKTKKRSKKKVRDLKQKSRKCLKDEELVLGSALQAKKLKPDPISKCSALAKAEKCKDDVKDMPGLSKETVLPPKEIVKSKELGVHEDKMEIATGPRGRDAQPLHNVEAAPQMKDDSSSDDSDDSIEMEIQRFLAEKAKVSTTDNSKNEGVPRNGTAVVGTQLRSEDIKQENQLAEIPKLSVSPLSGPSPHPLPVPQRSARDIFAVPGQSRLPSVPSCSPSLLEPADGAGAARAEQKRGEVHDVPPRMNRVQTVLTPNALRSHSEAIKWRQSLGLPTSVLRAPSRTPFQITSSETSETTSAILPFHSVSGGLKRQTAADGVWSCARTSRAPFSCAAETDANPTYRSTVLNFFSTARQNPKTSLAPGHRSQCSVEEERKSTVHISKDKSVFVELESNRTNHVQIQSRDRSEGKQRADVLSERKREGESVKIEKEGMHLEIKEEEFIDEPDCESVDRRNPEQKQGFSTLSLSRAIDPGITIRPLIALTSEERCTMFRRPYPDEMYKKVSTSLHGDRVHNKALKRVKRKLQFIATGERKGTQSAQSSRR